MTVRAKVEEHYDAVAADYHLQYQRELLSDPKREYPANYFRLQLLLNAFAEAKVKRVLEVGVGEGTPLGTLCKMGMDVWGFDIAQTMVDKSRAVMKSLDQDERRIFWGDIQDPITYSHVLSNGQFDGVVAMGVMPHVQNDDFVLTNIRSLLAPGGTAFIEFRNKLFSLLTMNRYTFEFIMDDLLGGVDPSLRERVGKELEKRLRMDLPPVRANTEDGGAPGYDAILARFHNPLEMPELFARHGFGKLKLLFYHYHPAMPMLEKEAAEAFRREAIRLEHESSGWKGHFLCSAFVVQATKLTP